MIPITRKEKYINEIVGGGNTAPETPQTREELFFADILGEVVAPSPITRAEKYLAKIANKYNGELPEPVTRIERFLARAAGMDVTIPTPITREEMFWADYALIVEKEISGIPPLTFNAIAGTLKNYKIYGNTVNGESVGDKTENIFDKTKANRIYGTARNADGTMNYNTMASNYIDYYIPVKPNTDYSIKGKKTGTVGYVPSRLYFFDVNKVWINRTDPYGQESNIIQFTTPSSCNFIQMQEDQYREMDFVTFMIVEGSAVPENYIPYGYRVPITNNSETANIYLDEPLRLVGDKADYVDYAIQKWHRVRKNLLENTAISRIENGVTFTVNSDGSIVCDGQASPSTATLIFSDFLVPSGTYILTGCPNGGSERKTYKMLLFINGAWLANDMGSGANFTLTKTSTVSVRIDIYNGYTCDNLTFYPMIREADIEDDTYEPYIENTEVDVTLPEIAVTAGTNTLTVGTEVQPSNVYIKYEGER